MQINVENFSKICRTCFSEESLVPISTSKLQDDVSVAEVLSDFIPISDLANDQMPSQICSLCIHNLSKYYLFKNSCFENESFLKSCLEKYISETKEFIKPDITDEYDVSDLDSDIHDDLPLILRIDNPIKKKRRRKQGNENNVYTCKQCNKTFQFRYKLVMHLRVHTKEKPFKCDECNLGFSLRGNLKRHKMIHSGDRPHICKICEKGFIQATSLHMHIQKHHTSNNQPNFTCEICSRVFIRMAPYNLHMKKQHSTNSEQELVPEAIEKKAPKMEFQCNICEKEFAKLVFLRRHESRHGEKKFLCSDCGKGFVRKADLQSHIKVHTGEKPHKCSICNKTFAHTGSLVTHTLVHSGYKPYSCYICSKPFTQLSHLKVHQRTHNGERPYSCSYCGKTFALKSNLTVHIRTHTGETPYVCTVCGRGFCDSSSLKKHKNSHLNVMESNTIKTENHQAISA